MKHALIKLQLGVLGHCYCAAPEGQVASLQDLSRLTLAVPSRGWAEHTADRRTRRDDGSWSVIKWGRR